MKTYEALDRVRVLIKTRKIYFEKYNTEKDSIVSQNYYRNKFETVTREIRELVESFGWSCDFPGLSPSFRAPSGREYYNISTVKRCYKYRTEKFSGRERQMRITNYEKVKRFVESKGLNAACLVNRDTLEEIRKDRGFLHELRNRVTCDAPHLDMVLQILTDWIEELKIMDNLYSNESEDYRLYKINQLKELIEEYKKDHEKCVFALSFYSNWSNQIDNNVRGNRYYRFSEMP